MRQFPNFGFVKTWKPSGFRYVRSYLLWGTYTNRTCFGISGASASFSTTYMRRTVLNALDLEHQSLWVWAPNCVPFLLSPKPLTMARKECFGPKKQGYKPRGRNFESLKWPLPPHISAIQSPCNPSKGFKHFGMLHAWTPKYILTIQLLSHCQHF